MIVLGHYRAPSFADPDEVLKFTMVDFSDHDPRDKMSALRELINTGGQNPLIKDYANYLVRCAKPRDNRGEAAVLLRYVQEEIDYRSEGTETFQGAHYTLRHKAGDCDDKVILFCSLVESMAIPTRLCVLGKKSWLLARPEWFHVYAEVGFPRADPQAWHACETILKKPLGWDPIYFAKAHML